MSDWVLILRQWDMHGVLSHVDRSIKCICLLTAFAYLQLHSTASILLHTYSPFSRSLCKCYFKCREWTLVSTNVLFIFFSCMCKPHRFSVASYMLLQVQDFRGRCYTGPGIQSRPVYHAMEIHNTKWQMLNDFCILLHFSFWQARDDLGFFFQAKEDLCVSIRCREPD